MNSLLPKPLKIGMYKLIVDNKSIKKVTKLGYPEDYLRQCLEQGERNYATTTYYLLSDT